MTGLEAKLNQILNEKNEKILPENIKKDVQIFDIIGTYEGSGGETVSGIKSFSTREELILETPVEGDKAIVYNQTDGFIGYYETGNNKFYKIPSKEELIYSATDLTFSCTYNNPVLLDYAKVQSLLVKIFNETGWMTEIFGTTIPCMTIYKAGGQWYSSTFTFKSLTNGNTVFGSPMIFEGDNFSYIGDSRNTGATEEQKFMICELDFETCTYDLIEEKVPEEIIEGSQSTRYLYKVNDLETIPVRFFRSAGQTIDPYLYKPVPYEMPSDGGSVYTVESTIPETAEILQYNLIDSGLIYSTKTATATANDISEGVTAFVKGKEIIGNIYTIQESTNFSLTSGINNEDDIVNSELGEFPQNVQSLIVSTTPNMNMLFRQGSTYRSVLSFDKLAELIGLTADKIKAGETILGITGTYEGNYEETITPEEYTEAQTQINDLFGEEE